MSKKKINDVLDCISKMKENKVIDITRQDGESGPILSFGMASPYEADKAVGFTISFEEEESVYTIDIMYIVFAEVKEELFDQINELICDINLGMLIGNFVLIKYMNAVVFNLGFFAFDEMSAENIARQAVHNMDIIEKEASGSGMLLHRFIKGDISFEEAMEAVNVEEDE